MFPPCLSGLEGVGVVVVVVTTTNNRTDTQTHRMEKSMSKVFFFKEEKKVQITDSLHGEEYVKSNNNKTQPDRYTDSLHGEDCQKCILAFDILCDYIVLITIYFILCLPFFRLFLNDLLLVRFMIGFYDLLFFLSFFLSFIHSFLSSFYVFFFVFFFFILSSFAFDLFVFYFFSTRTNKLWPGGRLERDGIDWLNS